VKAFLAGLCLPLLLAALLGCAGRARPAAVEDFLELCAAADDFTLTSSAQFFDITPGDLFSSTSCQIFKDGFGCESYLLKGREIRRLGSGFGGYGLSCAEPCDLGGAPGLIYAYSFGSGMHRAQVAVLNLETLEESVLDYAFFQGELLLKRQSSTRFGLYSAEAALGLSGETDFAKLPLRQGELLGEITLEGGAATLLPAEVSSPS
jgi:hypothetical protein